MIGPLLMQELKELVAEYGRRIRYLDQESEISGDAAYGIVTLENGVCGLSEDCST